MQKSVLGLLYQSHEALSEHAEILRNALGIIDGNALWDKQEEIKRFFDAHIVDHFRSEEAVMAVVRRHRVLDAAQDAAFADIEAEHKVILRKYEMLKTAGDKLAGAYSHESSEKYIESFNALLEDLFRHAKKEDEILYPFLNGVMDERMMDEASKAIAAEGGAY